MKCNENSIYLILIALYSFQGVLLSFYMSTLSIFLVEKGASLSEIAILHLSLLPFSFKLIYAPFLDVFYIHSLGKRRTYLLISNYILSILLFLGSFYIEEWISQKEIYTLMYFGFVCIFLLALQDIAADGLGSDVFQGDQSIYASLSQNIGINIGMIISSYVLVQLNSPKFCQKYLSFLAEENKGILEISHFLIICGFSLFIITLILQKNILENDADNKENNSSLKAPIYAMKKFILNPHLLIFIGFCFVQKLTFSVLESSFRLKLIQKGLQKEDLANISSVLLFIGIPIQILLPKILKKISELKLIYLLFPLKFIENIVSLIILETFLIENADSKIFWIALISIFSVDHFIRNVSYASLGSVAMKISQIFFIGYEETSIAFLTSVANLSKRASDFLSLTLIDYFEMKKLAIIGWIVGGTLLLIFRKKLLNLEKIFENQKEMNEKLKGD